MKLLDCFCGMGGVSDGFALEGFDVTGIDIVDAPKMLGYKHHFIQADMLSLKGEHFKGFDVIWGSPPCRDFSPLGRIYGKYWKNPPSPEKGLEFVRAFLTFVHVAKPKIWIMENVANLKNFLPLLKPRAETIIDYGKRHVFYGNFPLFLMTRDRTRKTRGRTSTGRDTSIWKDKKLGSWMSAKIPLACSQAFARVCKESLLSTATYV